MTSVVALTVPTLEPKVAERACRLAMEHTSLSPVAYYVVHDIQKQGGAKSANIGLRWALKQGAPYVCYINDDVDIMQQGWLERLIEVLESNKRYCCAAPGGHCATFPQNKAIRGARRGYQTVKHLSHFCVVHKREALEDIGIFDEAFFHYGCDNDWNLRAAQKGWKLVWVRDVWVHHWGCHPGRRMVDWMKHDQALYRKRRVEGYYR